MRPAGAPLLMLPAAPAPRLLLPLAVEEAGQGEDEVEYDWDAI